MFILSLVTSTLFLGARALTPNNIAPVSTSGSLSALKYTSVGGSGTYNQVTNLIPGDWPSCSPNPSCITQPKQISVPPTESRSFEGNLAPFDDELTVVFRGPMNLQVLGLQVRPLQLGVYEQRRWRSQRNMVASVVELNIMTAASCNDGLCDGFSRGTANHGWAGSKMFVFTFDMPPSSDATKTPAIWALNAQIAPRALGTTTLFARPTSGQVTYGVILDVQTDSIAIQRYTEWDYTQAMLTRSIIDGYLSSSSMLVSFNTNVRRRERPRSFMGAHRRHHGGH
ncbi:Protein TOS1 [Grifola frondosa]|uniref:Protein TOS1 n=1 Tax=Grifola frondosa TaxID=5627 RepID=A0A1C7LYG9_GRIFR|nr:Protein TOS1 [Grifola frondosa]